MKCRYCGAEVIDVNFRYYKCPKCEMIYFKGNDKYEMQNSNCKSSIDIPMDEVISNADYLEAVKDGAYIKIYAIIDAEQKIPIGTYTIEDLGDTAGKLKELPDDFYEEMLLTYLESSSSHEQLIKDVKEQIELTALQAWAHRVTDEGT